MVAIGRHLEGVTLNPLEFILNGDNLTIKVFESEKVARQFLMGHGVDQTILDDFTYQEVKSDGSPVEESHNVL